MLEAPITTGLMQLMKGNWENENNLRPEKMMEADSVKTPNGELNLYLKRKDLQGFVQETEKKTNQAAEGV